MALRALTTADVFIFASKRDPSVTVTKVLNDATDASKGFKEEVVIGEGASKFGLRPLDVFLMGHIYDNATELRTARAEGSDVGIHTRINQTNIDAVRFSLCTIENFPDKSGMPVRMQTQPAQVNGRDYEVAHEDVLNSLGLKLIEEMAVKVKEISEVSAVDAKNSGGASLPSV